MFLIFADFLILRINDLLLAFTSALYFLQLPFHCYRQFVYIYYEIWIILYTKSLIIRQLDSRTFNF